MGEVVVGAGGGVTVSRESARRAVSVLKAALRAGWLGTGDLAMEACLIVTFFEQGAGVSDETRARGLVGRVLDAAGGGHPNTAAVNVVAEALRDAFNAGAESLAAENAALRERVAELERQLALARTHPAEANLTVACLEYAAMLQTEGGAR